MSRSPQAASRKPQAASRKPQAASRKPQALATFSVGPPPLTNKMCNGAPFGALQRAVRDQPTCFVAGSLETNKSRLSTTRGKEMADTPDDADSRTESGEALSRQKAIAVYRNLRQSTGVARDVCDRATAGLVDNATFLAAMEKYCREVADVAESVGRELMSHDAVSRPLDRDFVLVVDDDPAYAKALSRAIDAADLKAFCELNPLRATTTFNVVRPATVFIDIVMPERDGFEVARDLRSLAPDALIVLVTGLLDHERARKSHESADYLVAKECEMRVLVAMARGELPEERVVLPKGFLTDEQMQRLHARTALDRFGSARSAAEALGVNYRTVRSRTDS